MAMTFGIHIGHMGGPMSEMRRLWKFADERGFDWRSFAARCGIDPEEVGV